MQPFTVAPYKSHTITLQSGEQFHVVIFGGCDKTYRLRKEPPPPVLFCVHGAGMCSSSFFVLSTYLVQPQRCERSDIVASALDETPGVVRVVTYDMRCHGDSTFARGEASLTLQLLIDDFLAVMAAVKMEFFPDTPHFYVVGHSLGGSVVVNALKRAKEMMALVAGVVLLDVVEGTAKMSLKHMDKFLEGRPERFARVEEATQWFLQRGGMTSPAAAAVTVPPLLRPVGDHYEWKSNLKAMSSVWSEWFEGLDEAFIALPCPKILCLANTERLDVAITVAQMQGKFQFEVLGDGCGHYVMDDQPVILAAKFRRFIRRIETMTEKLRMAKEKRA